MTRLFAWRYLTALIVYMYRREAFYANKHSSTVNYPRAFGLPPYRPEFFEHDVSTFETCWDPVERRAKSVIAYMLKRFTEAGV